MFGLEGSGFIVALGVTLLVSGAIVYYCNSRIAALEKALVQQNQVLSDFIVNMRTSIEKQSVIQEIPIVNNNNITNDHATDTALQAAKAYYSDTVPENKIEVSEDNESEEESDDEDDLESESDVESDEDSDNEGEVLQQIVISRDSEAIQQSVFGDNTEVSNLEIEEVNLDSSESYKHEQDEPKVVELTDGGFDLSSESVSEVQQVIKLGDVESLEEIEKTTSSSLSDASSLSSHDEDEDDASTVLSAKLAVTDLKKIKVTQLKEMAVSAGKIPAEAKKMKKAQLINFLQAKRAELQ
jgi:hypothetical protein